MPTCTRLNFVQPKSAAKSPGQPGDGDRRCLLKQTPCGWASLVAGAPAGHAGGDDGGCALEAYKEHLLSLVDLEWDAEQRAAQARYNKSLAHLQVEGHAICNLYGRRAARVCGQEWFVFKIYEHPAETHFPNATCREGDVRLPPQSQFLPGDEVLLLQREQAADGQVGDLGTLGKAEVLYTSNTAVHLTPLDGDAHGSPLASRVGDGALCSMIRGSNRVGYARARAAVARLQKDSVCVMLSLVPPAAQGAHGECAADAPAGREGARGAQPAALTKQGSGAPAAKWGGGASPAVLTKQSSGASPEVLTKQTSSASPTKLTKQTSGHWEGAPPAVPTRQSSGASPAAERRQSDTSSRSPDIDEEGFTAVEQSDVIKAVGESPVTLLQGPPGTGKTHTVCRVVEELFGPRGQLRAGEAESPPGDAPGAPRAKPVLVVAESNACVDQVAECLSRRGLDVARIGFSEKFTAAGALLREDRGVGLSFSSKVQKHPLYAECDTLQREIAARVASNNFVRDRAMLRALTAAMKEKERAAEEAVMAEADVVCATLVGCGHDSLSLATFRTVVVDEATRATEPQAVVALHRMARPGRVLLVGDHRQLPPHVFSQAAAEQGLGTSLFERLALAERPDVRKLVLRTQYRMHPAIRAWPNKAFYPHAMHDAPCVQARPWFPAGALWTERASGSRGVSDGLPLQFWGVLRQLLSRRVAFADVQAFYPGAEESEEFGGNGANIAEVTLTAELVELWLRLGPTSLGRVSQNIVQSIAILSTSCAQVAVIQEAMNRVIKKRSTSNTLVVSTIDGFQGQEADLVVLSTIRTDGVGFLDDERRINVAVTRARDALLVVGSARPLQSSQVWQDWFAAHSEFQ